MRAVAHSSCPTGAAKRANAAGNIATMASATGRLPSGGKRLLAQQLRLPQQQQPSRATRMCMQTKATVDRSSSGTSQQDVTIEYIKSQGPFLSVATTDAFSGKICYKSPVEYQYGSDPSQTLVAETTQGDIIYSSNLSKAEYTEAMGSFKEALRRLPGSGVRIERTFRPDPSTYMLRWCITWNSGGRSVRAQGSSKYTLDKQGLICGHEDSWSVDPKDEESEVPEFLDALAFASTRIPPRAKSPLGRLPAIRLATWEALKANPNYGGQLVREELDVFTMQMVFACAGLGASLALLVGRVLFLTSSN